MNKSADMKLLLSLREKISLYFRDTIEDHSRGLVSAKNATKGFDASFYRFLDLINLIQKSPGAKVLDIGIAHGFYDIVLKKNYGMDVIGVERQEKIPLYCRMLDEYGIKVIPANITQQAFPFADGSFDTVIFSEIIEHLRGHPLVPLKEIARVLRHGGQMVLSTPNMARFLNIVKLLRGINVVEEFQYRPNGPKLSHVTDTIMHIREYTQQELLQLVNFAGMKIDKIFMSRAWDRYNVFNEDFNLASKFLSELNVLVTLLLSRYRSFVMIRAVKLNINRSESK